MNESQKLLLRIIKKYLHVEKEDVALPKEKFDLLYNEARRHNIVQLLGSVYVAHDTEQKNALFNSTVQSMMHYERQEMFRKQIYSLFENCGIDYIPLKGSIIKDFYREPWHRTCGDIDILVRACDVDKAAEALEKQVDCTRIDKSEHDIVIKATENVILELHYDLHEKEINAEKVWQEAIKVNGYTHMYSMRSEMLVLCHIAHMAKHFRCSGCGLRPFVDLYIMNRDMSLNNDVLLQSLSECGLDLFYAHVVTLMNAWFNGESLPEELLQIAEYVVTGGVFGSIENKVAISRRSRSGIKYFWQRAFVSRKGLAYKYPILLKYPYLYLFCNTHRWYKLLFEGKGNNVKKELQANAAVNSEDTKRITKVLSDLGL